MFSPLPQIDIGYMYQIYIRFPPLSSEEEQARVMEGKGGVERKDMAIVGWGA